MDLFVFTLLALHNTVWTVNLINNLIHIPFSFYRIVKNIKERLNLAADLEILEWVDFLSKALISLLFLFFCSFN